MLSTDLVKTDQVFDETKSGQASNAKYGVQKSLDSPLKIQMVYYPNQVTLYKYFYVM